jgi:hypothetical protein
VFLQNLRDFRSGIRLEGFHLDDHLTIGKQEVGDLDSLPRRDAQSVDSLGAWKSCQKFEKSRLKAAATAWTG